MVMKKDIFMDVEAAPSTGGSRVIALGDSPRGRPSLNIFGFFENISLNSLGYFSDTFGIFLKIFWTISLHIFSTGGSRVIALGDGPRGRAPLAPTKKVILTQFFNLTY